MGLNIKIHFYKIHVFIEDSLKIHVKTKSLLMLWSFIIYSVKD